MMTNGDFESGNATPENHMGRQVDQLQASIQSQLQGVSEEML